MKKIIAIALFLSIATVLFSGEKRYYDNFVTELRDIVAKKDVKKLIDHLSPEGIEMIATRRPETWTKAKVAEFLNSKESNSIINFFFIDLPDEFSKKNVDIFENSQKDGCDLDSNLRGKGIQVKIKKKGTGWVIAGFGYL